MSDPLHMKDIKIIKAAHEWINNQRPYVMPAVQGGGLTSIGPLGGGAETRVGGEPPAMAAPGYRCACACLQACMSMFAFDIGALCACAGALVCGLAHAPAGTCSVHTGHLQAQQILCRLCLRW